MSLTSHAIQFVELWEPLKNFLTWHVLLYIGAVEFDIIFEIILWRVHIIIKTSFILLYQINILKIVYSNFYIGQTCSALVVRIREHKIYIKAHQFNNTISNSENMVSLIASYANKVISCKWITTLYLRMSFSYNVLFSTVSH